MLKKHADGNVCMGVPVFFQYLSLTQGIPEAKKMKTTAVATTSADTESPNPESPDAGVGDELTSKDYYFDSYSHFGTCHTISDYSTTCIVHVPM